VMLRALKNAALAIYGVQLDMADVA
jgi:hypothetical protein